VTRRPRSSARLAFNGELLPVENALRPAVGRKNWLHLKPQPAGRCPGPTDSPVGAVRVEARQGAEDLLEPLESPEVAVAGGGLRQTKDAAKSLILNSSKCLMFVGSDRGGRTAARLYSLLASCKRQHVDPYAYLMDILERLPAHPADRLGEFLPDAWIAANPDARRRVAS